MTSEAVQAVAAPKAIEMSPRSKVKRVVQPVPLQAEKTAVKRGAVYGRKVYATNVIEKKPTRFIYSGGPKDTQTPVFYSAEAAKSR